MKPIRQPVKCSRCGYEWTPRMDPEAIRSCPMCKSYAWRKPRPEGTKEQNTARQSVE